MGYSLQMHDGHTVNCAVLLVYPASVASKQRGISIQLLTQGGFGMLCHIQGCKAGASGGLSGFVASSSSMFSGVGECTNAAGVTLIE